MSKADLSATQIRRLEQYKDRWTSFGANTGILTLSEKPTPQQLKQFAIFQDYDDKFLEKISQDVSLATWKSDTVLFEEGSYIDVAFYIVKGNVDVYIQKQQKPGQQGVPIFDATRTTIMSVADVAKPKPEPKAAAASSEATVFLTQITKQSDTGGNITFLSTMDFNLPSGSTVRLGEGELFGEIGAMTGWPQSVTAKTASECKVVQIRMPALRLMRKRSKALKERLDNVYRERSLGPQLMATPLFRGCDEGTIKLLQEKVELISCEPDEIITKEGESADALYVVRSGFVKLSQKVGAGSLVVSYLSKGSTLGEAELLMEGMDTWLYTASSKEYSELLKISRKDFEQMRGEIPSIEKQLWDSVVLRTKEAGYSRKNIRQSEFIDSALNKGLVEGNSILVIDLNVCTRCDDCVRGCAETHEGIPRFIREGDKYENLLITRACNHCRDPVCLVGCPTGAIHRAAVGDVVEIDPRICIGCSTCANNCPYDAITMFETGKVWPDDMIPEALRGKDRQLATKCDLCYKDEAGPACVRSCPHGCAHRVGSIQEFQTLIWKEL